MRDFNAIANGEIQSRINSDLTHSFRARLPGQCEHTARKLLETLQRDVLGPQHFDPTEVLALAQSIDLLLGIRDRYGE